jgi:threonine/homoserine/homoserine lactone efflux protein
MLATLLAFVGVSIFILITPGPDTALTIRNSLIGGRKTGVFTALGVAIGLSIWAFASSLGLVALIVASEPVFLAVKYAGAAFLIWLGACSLVSAWRGKPDDAAAMPARGRLSPWAGLSQGVASNLSNPKMVALFTSLLPQFATTGEGAFASLLLLGLTFCAMTFVWLTLYAVVVARAGDVLRRRNVRRAIEAATGGVLIALGVRMVAEQR